MVGEPWMNARYSRHRSLPDFGEIGQKALVESTVICIGAGGLEPKRQQKRGAGWKG